MPFRILKIVKYVLDHILNYKAFGFQVVGKLLSFTLVSQPGLLKLKPFRLEEKRRFLSNVKLST
jgi:hypothetical protein